MILIIIGHRYEPTAAIGDHQAPQKTTHFSVVEAIWEKQMRCLRLKKVTIWQNPDALLNDKKPQNKPADEHY